MVLKFGIERLYQNPK